MEVFFVYLYRKFSGMKYSLVIFFVFCTTCFFAQAPAIEWNNTYGGSQYDNGTCVIHDTINDRFTIFGYTHSNNGNVSGNHSSFSDYWIFNSNYTGGFGNQKCIGGSNYDDGKHILQLKDGNYLLTGAGGSSNGHQSANYGSYDYWLVKTDPLFNIIWEKNLGGSSFDVAYQSVETYDGGIVVVGTTYSNSHDVTANNGFSDYWIAKVNANGVLQWQKNYGGSDEETAHSIVELKDKKLAVAGFSKSLDGNITNPKGNQDFWVLLLDSAGNMIWQKSLGGTSTDIANSIIQTYDGNLLVFGETSSASGSGDVTFNHGGSDFWLVKLNLSGNIIWQKTYGGNLLEIAGNVIEDVDSGFVMVGRTQSDDNGDVGSNMGMYDMWIVKTDSLGNLLWQHTLGGTNNDGGLWVSKTSDLGYIVSGFSESNYGYVNGGNKGMADVWVVKLEGKEKLEDPEPGSTQDLLPKQGVLIYPNPAAGLLHVSLPLSTNGSRIMYQVFDVHGRMLMSEMITESFFQISTERLAHGMYFLHIYQAGIEPSKYKFIVVE